MFASLTTKKYSEVLRRPWKKLKEVTRSLDKIKETNQSSSNAVPSNLSFAEFVSGINQNTFEQEKRSKNLVLFVTKPDSDNTEASDNCLVSEITKSLKVNKNIESQKIGSQKTECKQLLRIKCEKQKM